jgi:hypothetical protein
MARATNSQLQQDQEEELSQQQEAMAVSKFDVITNRLHHAKYKNGHEQFKKIMHQSKFATFIGKQCKVQTALRAGPHVFPQRFPIQHFTNSARGMWDDDAPLVLGWLKQNYLVDYAALPLNTHLAESNVKDANLRQIKGRTENLSSTFSTTRSGIVGSLNESTNAAFKAEGKIIKGTRTVTGGTYGNKKIQKRWVRLHRKGKQDKSRWVASISRSHQAHHGKKCTNGIETYLACQQGKMGQTERVYFQKDKPI